MGGTTWSLDSFVVGSDPHLLVADRDDWSGNTLSFDSGLAPVYLDPAATGPSDYSDASCAADGDRVTATDGTGDVIVTCPLDSFQSGTGTLDATFELRFFSDGATVRSRLIVSNSTALSVADAVVGFVDDYYQDGDTQLGASTTAGHPAAAGATTINGDLLWIIYDARVQNVYEGPVILTAAGAEGAAVSPVIGDSAGNGEDSQATLFPLPTLAAGESVQIVQFTVWNFFAFDSPLTEKSVPTPGPESEVSETSAEAPADIPLERVVTEVVTGEGLTKSAFLAPAALFVPSALAAVAQSWADRGRFTSLSVRDAAGITDTDSVLNWKAVAQLAATGPSSLLPFATLAVLLLLVGAAVAAGRRRAA